MTTSSRSASVTLPTDGQILITREFDAPKHLVYEAYTTPEYSKRWWHAKRGDIQHTDKAGRDAHIEAGMEDGLQDALDLLERVARSLY